MRWLFASLTAAAALATAGFVGPAAGAATTKCPTGGTPAPGSTITGGLEVDGFHCILADVTVYGGITVDANGPGVFPIGVLELSGSTVNGGIVVNGGGIDIDNDYFFFDRPHEPSIIRGGLTLNHALYFSSADATIYGGVTMNGQRDPAEGFGCPPVGACFINSYMCANTIFGNVVVADVAQGQVFDGDPGFRPYGNGRPCGVGNTIHGSVLLKNSNFINPFSGEANEIEGDTINGSVSVDHSTAEVSGNTIGGSLLCTNGSVMLPPGADDSTSSTNTVTGANTCF